MSDHHLLKPDSTYQSDGDETTCNASSNPKFAQILHTRLQRRQVMQGGIAAAIAILFNRSRMSHLFTEPAVAATSKLGFSAIPVSEADTIVVPKGYTARTLIPYGEPITGSYPRYQLSNSGTEQGMQIGSHHDGMHFFPIEGRSSSAGSSTEGLLVVNHEYIEPRFMHEAATGLAISSGGVPLKSDGKRDTDQVLKEIHAHGVSIVHIRQQADGNWEVERDARNRRITALTPMELRGPVRGSDWVKTRYSPDGTRTRGTLNNCSHGVTPWNTYLTCEENWAGYFRNGDRAEQKPNLPREQARYGVTDKSRYGWELADNGADEYIRFDASTRAEHPTQDYRSEPHTFGWIVEINPFDPNSVPIKHTALGRFAHEGVIFHKAIEGQPVVCYSGDDTRFEYIYKYVSAQPYRSANANSSLLDEGTLYVAKFNDDGSGEWIALVWGQNGLNPANGFKNQADVLVNTRTAADFVGATQMDRPEWGAIDPKTAKVYFSLTNNSKREEAQVNKANPRAQNKTGHIIRWQETDNSPAATTFEWDLFLLAGSADHSRTLSGQPLDSDNIFASPDGLWFDSEGRLWIQTDIGEDALNTGDHTQFGNNQMLAADPERGEIRRFLVGPIGQEITGVVMTPDLRTMFVNVQHPGATTAAEDFAAGKVISRWPDFNSQIYPRSATVVITKDDGGVIGT